MLDKLELLLFLARERHFGRAAEAAGITQPTLSFAIKSLEEQLGVVLVDRGSRFQGFTPEGERVLAWARRLVADARTMRQDVEAMRRGLGGTLRLAVIPTALPLVASLTTPIAARHADVAFRISSMSHDHIVAAIGNLEIDAAITYLDNATLSGFTTVPLFVEMYSLLVAPDNRIAGREQVAWSELGEVPLCLLTPDMQHRRNVDRQLAEAGVRTAPRIESNSLVVLLSHVRTGRFASVMPTSFARSMDPAGLLRSIPITEPPVRHIVGLLARRREPQPPLVAALLAEARHAADTDDAS